MAHTKIMCQECEWNALTGTKPGRKARPVLECGLRVYGCRGLRFRGLAVSTEPDKTPIAHELDLQNNRNLKLYMDMAPKRLA